MAIRSAHLSITGRVQGVGYRAWFEHEALRFGLAGWVRNRRDGSVEAVVSGVDDVVAEIIKHSWRGPAAALVEAVEVSDAEAPADGGFEVKATA